MKIAWLPVGVGAEKAMRLPSGDHAGLDPDVKSITSPDPSRLAKWMLGELSYNSLSLVGDQSGADANRPQTPLSRYVVPLARSITVWPDPLQSATMRSPLGD